MPKLSLDPQSLQALNDLIAATKQAAAANKAQTQATQQQAASLAGLHGQAALGNQHSAMMQSHLQNLTNLQMGQAMGQKLWQNPVNGQMHWIPGGPGGGGGGGGPGGGKGGGGKGVSGFLEGLGVPKGLSPYLAPLAIAHTTQQALEHGGRLVNDRYTGGANAERQFARAVIPGAGTLMRTIDAVTGRDARIEQNKIDAEIGHAKSGLYAERASFYTSSVPEMVGRQSVAEAYKKQHPSAAAPPVIDRSSAGGEQAYKDAMKILPLTKERLRTERELWRTSNEQRQAESNLTTKIANRLSVEKQIAETRAKADRWAGRDAEKENRALQELDVLQKRHENMTADERAAHGVLADKKTAAGSARAEYEKAKIREEKSGQAEVLQDRADRAKSTAATLGSMNPLEREQALQAVEIGKKHGLDALPPEMKQLFQQLAPKEYEAAAVKAGSESDVFGRLQRAGVVDAGGGPQRTLFGANVTQVEKPAEIQKKADTMRKEAAEGEHGAETRGADVAAKAGDKLFEAAEKLFDEAIRRASQKIEDKVRLSKSS